MNNRHSFEHYNKWTVNHRTFLRGDSTLVVILRVSTDRRAVSGAAGVVGGAGDFLLPATRKSLAENEAHLRGHDEHAGGNVVADCPGDRGAGAYGEASAGGHGADTEPNGRTWARSKRGACDARRGMDSYADARIVAGHRFVGPGAASRGKNRFISLGRFTEAGWKEPHSGQLSSWTCSL